MNLVRSFLWALVGVMTLQGFLHADEYGSAPSMIGGISLTMSIWHESMSSGARNWFSSVPKFVALPRVAVQAALKETMLHPGIQVVPKLRQTLQAQQRVWDQFREREINWLLGHSYLIGAIQSDPDARAVWTHWRGRLDASTAALEKAKGATCRVSIFDPAGCEQVSLDVVAYERQIEYTKKPVYAWEDVMHIGRVYSAQSWLRDIYEPANTTDFGVLHNALARLHDIETPRDPRLELILANVQNISAQNVWVGRLLRSLLTGEVWAACLEHVRLREGRTRELMMVAGVQDMINSHERILNASLRVVTTADDRRKVQDWFGEMAGYAWFIPDTMPALIRRCVGQEAGDCTRIGPTEIIALTEKSFKQAQIVDDWSRRLFIGMWNAMPVIGILFLLELVMLCLPYIPYRYSQEVRVVMLKPEGGQKQMVLSDRQQIILADS